MQSVAARMKQAFDSRTSAHKADPTAADSSSDGAVEGVHWQLLSLRPDAPPACLVLHEALSRTLLQSTMLPRSLLTTLILGVPFLMYAQLA
jgi:hypothetical protein